MVIFMKYGVVEKKVDKQGRIVLPKEWRKKVLKDHKVVMVMEENEIILIPREKRKLSSYFQKAKKSELKPDPFANYEKALEEASLG